MTTTFSARLAGSPQSARTARALVRGALGDAHPSAADAELVVSELVGNAVTHSRSGEPGGFLTLTVELGDNPSEICIRVGDAGVRRHQAVKPADVYGEHGRGLGIVAALATDWGADVGPSGRSTWCRLAAREDQLDMPRKSQREPNGRTKRDPYARGAFVVQINEALRGRIGQDGQPMDDMWPEALHRTWRAEALQRDREQRERDSQQMAGRAAEADRELEAG